MRLARDLNTARTAANYESQNKTAESAEWMFVFFNI